MTALPLISAISISADLHAQLTSRVRWTESIRYLIQQGVQTFLELGSGNVLTGLLKRIDDQVAGLTIGAPQDFEKFRNTLQN